MTLTITTPTSNLDHSKEFYSKLHYTLLSENSPTIFTDGSAIIEINPDRYARPGVNIYKSSWQQEVEKLKMLTMVHEIPKGFLLNDLNGCWIYLIESDFPVVENVKGKNTAYPGNFSGLSLESTDTQRSLSIWEVLGFKIKMGSLNGGYVVLENSDGFNVSIMKPLTCPHLFFNPSMTYFNGGKNLENIKSIRAANIPITEEITHFNEEGIVDNIIIRDPGGYGFFIFND